MIHRSKLLWREISAIGPSIAIALVCICGCSTDHKTSESTFEKENSQLNNGTIPRDRGQTPEKISLCGKEYSIFVESVHCGDTLNIDSSAFRKFRNLKKLVIRIASMDDYSVLGELSSLEELVVQLPWNQEWKFLSKLTSLKKLSVLGQFEGIRFIANLTQLEYLVISSSSAIDLSSLKRLSSLRSLTLHTSALKDTAAIANLKKLEQLDLNVATVINLAPLNSVKDSLTSLNLTGIKASNFSVLGTLNHLENLNLTNSTITDLEDLSGARNLKNVNLSGTQIISLAPLTKLSRLEELVLPLNAQLDLTPLFKLKSLKRLHVNRSAYNSEQAKKLRAQNPDLVIRQPTI